MSHHGPPPTFVSFLIGGMTGVALAALLMPRPAGAWTVRAGRRAGRALARHRSRRVPEPALATAGRAALDRA